MTLVLTLLHVFVCIFLVAVVLLFLWPGWLRPADPAAAPVPPAVSGKAP